MFRGSRSTSITPDHSLIERLRATDEEERPNLSATLLLPESRVN